MLLPVVSLLVAEHLGGAPVQLVQQQLRGVRPASQPPAARHGPGLAESATSDQCWCCVIYAGCPLRWEVKTGGVIIGKRRGVATALPGQKQSGQSLLSGAMVQPGGTFRQLFTGSLTATGDTGPLLPSPFSSYFLLFCQF